MPVPTLRVVSDQSGHDTGPLPLPCQNWVAVGSPPLGPGDGYRYSDPNLEDGLCKSVLVRHLRTLAVSCRGKVGGPDFPYDLEAGVDEGTVRVILEIGGLPYCSEFTASGADDGSDGRRFEAGTSPTPSTCS